MSGAVRLAILGAGNVRCSPAVIASLATYFGERPLELRLYDADEERLDLFDRFARHCFISNKAHHAVLYRPDIAEALDQADRVVLQVDANCAAVLLSRKASGGTKDNKLIADALKRLMKQAPPEAETLSLQSRQVAIPLGLYRRLEWPPQPNEEQVRWMPHQILRWIRGDEQIHEILQENEKSPLKEWLNNPNAAELVINRNAAV